VIISRVPPLLPCRSSKSRHNRTRHAGHRPAARHCFSGVEPAIAPGVWRQLFFPLSDNYKL